MSFPLLRIFRLTPGRALPCVLGMLLWAPAVAVRAEPDPDAKVILAQADPSSEEDAAEAPDTNYVAPPSDVEVIRIKGRGVEAIETEVPESVASFDAAEIEALGAQNISDLSKVTPNVEIKTAGSTSPTFFIRGVGLADFSANASGSVAIYQDDVAINAPAMQLGLLYDIEQVSIGRGPKGYGSTRNDAGGSIKIYSRKPTGELAAQLRSSVGNYNLRDFQGHIEAPLIDEVLSARLAFRLLERDGTALNRCGNKNSRYSEDPDQNPDGLDILALDPRAFPGERVHPDDFISPIRKFPSRAGYRGDIGGDVLGPSYPGQPKDEWDTYYHGVKLFDQPNYPPDSNAMRYKGVRFCNEGSLPTVMEYRQGEDGDLVLDRAGLPRAYASDARVSGIPAGLEEEMNDLGSWGARGQLRFQPRGVDMDWILKLSGSRLDQLSTVGQAIGTKGRWFGGSTKPGYREPDQVAGWQEWQQKRPDDEAGFSQHLADDMDLEPFEGDYNRTGPTTLDVWGASLRGDWDLGPATLRNVSGYDYYTRYRDEDQDFTPKILFERIGEDSAWQFFQELKLGGEFEDTPFVWGVGGYYLMESVEFWSGSLSENQHAFTIREYSQDTTSFAFYADFAWDFLDDFTLEGGVRYQWNRADLDFSLRTRTTPDIPPFFGSETWMAPTGGLSLSYRFTDESNVYWKYTRGWKPGTWNTSANKNRGANAADPVTIDSWEMGLRGSWFDGRFSMGGALFYYKYIDYQVLIVLSEVAAAPTLTVLNASDAEVYGGELDLRIEPLVGWVPSALDGLVLGANFGWLESEFIEFTNEIYQPVGFFSSVIMTADYSGESIVNAPRFKASGNVEWTFDLGRFGSISPRYDFTWSDAIAFDPNSGRGNPNPSGETFLPENAIGQRAFWLHNLRLMYRTPGEGNTEIALWVRNLDDFVYKTYGFDASTFQDVVINYIGDPRTFGLDITFHW